LRNWSPPLRDRAGPAGDGQLGASGRNRMTGLRNSSAIGSLDSVDDPSDDNTRNGGVGGDRSSPCSGAVDRRAGSLGVSARAGCPGDHSVESVEVGIGIGVPEDAGASDGDEEAARDWPRSWAMFDWIVSRKSSTRARKNLSWSRTLPSINDLQNGDAVQNELNSTPNRG
jgi:hypothetical protein